MTHDTKALTARAANTLTRGRPAPGFKPTWMLRCRAGRALTVTSHGLVLPFVKGRPAVITWAFIICG